MINQFFPSSCGSSLQEQPIESNNNNFRKDKRLVFKTFMRIVIEDSKQNIFENNIFQDINYVNKIEN